MDPDDPMDVDPPENDNQPHGVVVANDVDPTPRSQPAVADQDPEPSPLEPLSPSSPTDPSPFPPSSPANPLPHASFPPTRRPNNWERREIARTTIATIDDGSFELDGQVYDLEPAREALIEGTVYYQPISELGGWSKDYTRERRVATYNTAIEIVQCSTLEGCWGIHETLGALEGEGDNRIGVLNFASAKKPGGGFLTGAQAQEETIARSSTLYASLMLDTAQQFYDLHHAGPKDGYYTHAMIYSPHVHIFRNDAGDWHPPYEVDIVTSPAVNAGDVRRKSHWENPYAVEREIEDVMKERMGRLLYLFEKEGVKNLVLGSFGTGVFRNSVELVAKLWIGLLVAEGSRFKGSFERVVFAIIDTPTVTEFRDVFSGKEESEEEGSVLSSEWDVGEAQVSRASEEGDGQGRRVLVDAEANQEPQTDFDSEIQEAQAVADTGTQKPQTGVGAEAQEQQAVADARTLKSRVLVSADAQEHSPIGDDDVQESQAGGAAAEVSAKKAEPRL